MLKIIKPPDPRNYPFAAILFFSVVLHAVVLTQLHWKTVIPVVPEVMFEVQLLEPEKKVVIPKRIQPKPAVVKKLKPGKKPTLKKPPVSKKQTAPPPKTASSAPSANPPPKPVLKPSLNIMSDVSQSDSLQENKVLSGSPPVRPPSSRPLISRIKVPESKIEDQLPVVENKLLAPSLPLKPGNLHRVPQVDDLDSSQIAASNQQTDIKTEIRSQKDAVQFRIVEQKGDGKTHTIGTDDAGESKIEGELKQRKVIYKPDPPVIDLEKDVTITLKFTVLPNGEVDQIFPYRKAEPKLERLAMQLLRQYRFEPLFENDKVQHGIIHFSIYRSRL